MNVQICKSLSPQVQQVQKMEQFSRTNAYDHLLKILLVGDTSSNKRALLRTYLEDSATEEGTTTMG